MPLSSGKPRRTSLATLNTVRMLNPLISCVPAIDPRRIKRVLCLCRSSYIYSYKLIIYTIIKESMRHYTNIKNF